MDDTAFWALALAGLAGASIPIGAALSGWDRLLPRWMQDEFRHTVLAFGAGALFAAVALVLVPKGADALDPLPVLTWFAAGGIGFALVDRWLARSGGQWAQFLAMLLDFLPEAMALGALIAGDIGTAVLMAALIALQNLPEAFNAYREMQKDDRHRPHLMLLFAAMVPMGLAAAWLGLTVLQDRPDLLGAVMLFASGGILYLLFEDVAPAVPLEGHVAPPLGAVAGFLLGLAGHMATGG